MKRYLVLLALLVIFTAQVWAEENDKTDLVSEILTKPLQMILKPVGAEKFAEDVAGKKDKEERPTLSFDRTVVTPTRTEEYIYNVNRNIDVITDHETETMNAKNVQEVLSQRAGIVLNGFMNNTKDNSLDMRGFGSTGNLNYLVMVNGRRINQIDLSGPDLAHIELKNIKQIEIIRGPNTVLYGDNATGGVINIITKKGEADYHAEYTQELGSYRYDKEYFSFNGSRDFMDYFFSAAWQDSDGYRTNNRYEANDITANLTLKPSENVSLLLASNYHRDWYGQPGALYDGNLQSDGRKASRFPDSKAKTEDYFMSADLRIKLESEEHDVAFSVPFTYRSRRANARDVGFNIYETNHNVISFDFRPKLEFVSDIFDGLVRNKLIMGVDYFSAEDQVLSGDVAFTKAQIDMEKETLALYASDNMLINDLFTLSGGLRGEWADYRFDQWQPASSIDEKSLRDIAFDAGAGYKYNERSQFYAHYARSYRFPTTDEYFQSAYETFDWWTLAVRVFPATLNFDLKQQVANNYEIGIKDNTWEKLRLKADYYVMDIKNEIYYDPINFANENYHHTLHHGLEMEAEMDLCKEITGRIYYTYQNASFKSGKYGGYQIPLVPQHVISAGVVLRPIDPLTFGLNVNYVGNMPVANDPRSDSSPLEGRTTMDLTAAYELKEMRIFGVIRNVTGEKYFSNATRNFQGNTAFYPAPERSFEGGVSVRF